MVSSRLRMLPVAFVCLAVAAPARAENPNWPDNIADDADLSLPANMPDDPGYYRQRTEGETIVEVDGQWNLWSFMPEVWINNPGDPIREEEIALGPGMHVDRAWLLTPGRRDVRIAVLDSGVRWNNADLVNKYYLNAGELDRDGARPCVPEDFAGDPLDVNADGIFNIQDYSAFTAECGFDIDGEGNQNGMLDPQDLILSDRYADGVDDDANGYIDDISGWDFFWNDNDAQDDTDFGHGNGEAVDSAAEGNNGMGDIGVCPECTVIMLRVGDSFVVDANDFADAVVFAVDSGASVIQEALGAINNTPFAIQAIEYAYENNVVVIASAADELSFHHNLPGTNNHTVYVHAIVHDTPNRSRATTFLNFNNCTNFGAQLVLSTPGGGCSSEATGKSSGHAGLIYSYALDQDLDPPLSAEEVRGLMIMSVDDIDVPESQPGHPDNDGTKFPSAEGWDWHFGYGRNNVRRSLELIRDGAVPPELDIVSPLWFETIYPDDAEAEVPITGRIGNRIDGEAPRYASYDWELSVAQGVQPAPGDFDVVESGTTTGLEGEIARVSVADLAYTGVPDDPHEFTVTVRLRACVTGTGVFGEGTCNEFRKAFFVHQDPDLFETFPIYLGASGETSPRFADLNGDGAEELIVPTADGLIHIFESDGQELEGWPAELGPRKGHRDDQPNDHADACSYRPADDRGDCLTRGHVDYEVRHTTAVGGPAVANLEGDEGGDLEIVVTSFDGYVYVFHADGSLASGFPVRTNPAFSADTDEDNVWDEGISGAPIVYDLDDDGDLEIIAGAMDQHLYVWHHDGQPADGFPVYCRDFARDDDPDLTDSVGARIFATPAVGDIDNDGFPEILVGTNEFYDSIESRLYIVHWNGNEHESGSPFEQVDPRDEPGPYHNIALLGEVLPLVGQGIPTAPALADIDFDGYIEFAAEGIGGQPVMRRFDGVSVEDVHFMDISTAAFGEGSDVTDNFSYTLINHGAFGYLDDSGDLAYIKGAAGIDFALAFAEGGEAAQFDHQLAGWNVRTGDPLYGFPRVMEDWQFFVSPTIADLDDDNYPEVINGSGGYLLRAFNWEGTELEGWPKHTGGWIVASSPVGDFDGDGNRDVATITRAGYLFVWRTDGSADATVEWNGFGHDNMNTSNYETPLPGQVREGEPDDAGDEPGDEVADAGPDLEPDAAGDGGDGGDGGEGDADGTGDAGTQDDAGTTPGGGSDDGCCAVAGGSGNGLSSALLALGVLWVLVGRGRLRLPMRRRRP